MQLVLITQYFDTLKEIAANDRTNTVLVPHSPSTISDLSASSATRWLPATRSPRRPTFQPRRQPVEIIQ